MVECRACQPCKLGPSARYYIPTLLQATTCVVSKIKPLKTVVSCSRRLTTGQSGNVLSYPALITKKNMKQTKPRRPGIRCLPIFKKKETRNQTPRSRIGVLAPNGNNNNKCARQQTLAAGVNGHVVGGINSIHEQKRRIVGKERQRAMKKKKKK